MIAVTTSEIRGANQTSHVPEGEPAQQDMVLGLKYLNAIDAAGGIPMVAPPLHVAAVDALLDRVSGVCLSGGPDLHPSAYDERGHARLGPTWRELDEFELALVRGADERDIPILAICRGLQTLNVARGGSLHQHLPDVVGERINHRQQQPGRQCTHWVTIDPSSRLARILGCRRTTVNSFHHQAVARLGAGLRATGHAADGTIESLEAVDRSFALAVQWHVECLTDRPRHLAVFAAFVEAAREYQCGSGLARAA